MESQNVSWHWHTFCCSAAICECAKSRFDSRINKNITWKSVNVCASICHFNQFVANGRMTIYGRHDDNVSFTIINMSDHITHSITYLWQLSVSAFIHQVEGSRRVIEWITNTQCVTEADASDSIFIIYLSLTGRCARVATHRISNSTSFPTHASHRIRVKHKRIEFNMKQQRQNQMSPYFFPFSYQISIRIILVTSADVRGARIIAWPIKHCRRWNTYIEIN